MALTKDWKHVLRTLAIIEMLGLALNYSHQSVFFGLNVEEEPGGDCGIAWAECRVLTCLRRLSLRLPLMTAEQMEQIRLIFVCDDLM